MKFFNFKITTPDLVGTWRGDCMCHRRFEFDSTIFRSILQTRDGQIELRNEKNEQPYSILFEYLVLFFFQKYQFTNQRDCKINSNTQDDGRL